MAGPLDPAAWNRFSYVQNAPTNYVDPSGHFGFPFWDILDVGSFLSSANQYLLDPTLGNLFWLSLDAVSLLPIIPSVGLLRQAGRLDDFADAAKVARRVDNAELGETIIFYHATNTAGAENIRRIGIHPLYGRAETDFGQGFYMTRNLAQAQGWAEEVAAKYGGEPAILEFRVSRSELESLKGLIFDEPNETWQAFVTAHRTPGTPIHSYDFVEGPVAVQIEGAWVPHPNPTYHQISIHTKLAVEIFWKGLLP